MRIALALLLAFAVLPATAQTTCPPLRWGGDAEGGAPFVEADPSDPSVVRGFDVEVARMLGEGLGRAPRFVQVAWASLLPSLERGDFDVAMSVQEDHPEPQHRWAGSLASGDTLEGMVARRSSVSWRDRALPERPAATFHAS